MVDPVAASVNRFARKMAIFPNRLAAGTLRARPPPGLPCQGPAALRSGLPAAFRQPDGARAGTGGGRRDTLSVL